MDLPHIEWVKTCFDYGVPTGLFVLALVLAYRLAILSGNFLAPLIASLTTKHMATMETLEVVGKGLLQQQEAQTELMKRHDETLVSNTLKLHEIHRAVVK
jgi:hypothetical protein